MTKIEFKAFVPNFENDYDGLGGVDNPYAPPINDYECPYNCRDMSTYNFLLYSLMVVALGFFVGLVVGISI